MNQLFKNLYDFLVRPVVVYFKMLTGPLWQNKRFRLDYRASLKKFDLVLSSNIVQKDFEEIIDGKESRCQLLNATRRDGNLSLDALYGISRLVKYVNPTQIFEIGTFNGNTTLQMAVNSREECKIFTLDLDGNSSTALTPKYSLSEDDKKYVGSKEILFQGTPYEKKITRLLGDSAQFDFRPFYGQMDFVFIDGSHVFEYVKNDTEQAFRMFAPKGVIVWDDYDPSWPDVVRFLNQLARKVNLIWIYGTSLCIHIRS